MTIRFDFDDPSFAEVVAYLHGVSDGIRTRNAERGCDGAPCSQTCRPKRGVPTTAATTTSCDNAVEVPRVSRDTLPYRSPAQPPPLEVVGSAAGKRGVARATMPYVGFTSQPAVGEVGYDDRVSGVCLRANPVPAELYELTGTQDGRR